MIIPIRCFTCGKVLANKWNCYKQKVDEIEKSVTEQEPPYKNFDPGFKKQILDELCLNKLCCRRHLLTHVDLVDII